MKVEYKSGKVKEQCTDIRKATRLFGGDRALALKLLSRINALEQAEVDGQPVQEITEAAANGAKIQAEVNGPEIIITAEDGEEAAEGTEPEEAPQEYAMALYYHVTGEQRKALVAAVSAYTGTPVVYQNVPTFAYAIGEYRVDKEGTLTGPASEALITALQVRGFIAE